LFAYVLALCYYLNDISFKRNASPHREQNTMGEMHIWSAQWRHILRGAWRDFSPGYLPNLLVGLVLLFITPAIGVFMNSPRMIVIGAAIGLTVLIWIAAFFILKNMPKTSMNHSADLEPSFTEASQNTQQVLPFSDAGQTKPTDEHNVKKDAPELPSLEKLFKTEFPTLFRSYAGRNLGIKKKGDEKMVTIGEQLYLDFPGKSKFLGYYIPMLLDSYDVCAFMADEYRSTINDFESNASLSAGHVAEYSSTSQKELVFTGRVYIYHEFSFSHQQLADLEKLYRSKGLSVVFRGPAYLSLMWKPESK
jgi:hypothetical protein